MKIQRLKVANLQKYSQLEKLPQLILLKKRKTFAVSMNYFMKNLRNEIAVKYQKGNEILYEWYQGCCASNIYPNGPLAKEEAKAIKERLQDCRF